LRIAQVDARAATYQFSRAPLSYLFVSVTSDDGTVGVGEACDSYGCTYAQIVGSVVTEAYAPLLIDQELLSVDALADRMRLFTRRRLGDAWLAVHARSAVENALWDLAGKAAGRSVSALLGRTRETVPVYASATFLEEGDVGFHARLLAPLVERGVRHVKVRTGPDWERDLRTLAGVVDELPELEWMVDGSETYTLPTALRIAERLADLGVAWFEEPIPQNSHAALEELGRSAAVPIAYGEHLFGREDALDCLRHGWASVLQPDASTCGGISEARLMAQIATPFGARVVPHTCAGPLSLAANLHVAASVPGVRLIEYPFMFADAWREFGDVAFDVVDGAVAVPDGPGLGVTLDDSAVAAHPFVAAGARVAGTTSGLPDRFTGDR
jgi:L-alanine-DL-glutamate epimerase-like enolase superfamily enzyme